MVTIFKSGDFSKITIYQFLLSFFSKVFGKVIYNNASDFIESVNVFDTVDHKILLGTLHAYGIRGKIWRWFRSYLILTNISQFVSYDGIQCTIHSIRCGVPQGSIRGPLLFIIYMNDI